MPFRHIRDQAEIISEHIFEAVLLQKEPDPDFLESHAAQLLEWARFYRERGTPYQFQPHASHALESRSVVPQDE